MCMPYERENMEPQIIDLILATVGGIIGYLLGQRESENKKEEQK